MIRFASAVSSSNFFFAPGVACGAKVLSIAYGLGRPGPGVFCPSIPKYPPPLALIIFLVLVFFLVLVIFLVLVFFLVLVNLLVFVFFLLFFNLLLLFFFF